MANPNSINLDGDNVFLHDASLEEVRDMNDATWEEITGVIDEAQGHVHMEKSTVAYVVIRIIGG